MAYDIVKEGFIHRCPPDGPEQVAATGRCAVTRNGQILCSYMTQSALSQNDFVPMLSGSSDNGNSWQTHRQIWPHLRKAYSINVSISRSSAGDLFLFGSRTPRTRPDESFWSQETLGILQNELVWSRSMDDGATWTDPCAVAVPLPGAAESPAPLCITRTGRWVAPYSPHNTFDPNLKVDLRHVVLMQSDDQGQTWRHNSMIRVTEDDAYVAEAWVTELSTGVLLGTAWHLRRGPGDDFPNAYALSTDNGRTWGRRALLRFVVNPLAWLPWMMERCCSPTISGAMAHRVSGWRWPNRTTQISASWRMKWFGAPRCHEKRDIGEKHELDRFRLRGTLCHRSAGSNGIGCLLVHPTGRRRYSVC